MDITQTDLQRRKTKAERLSDPSTRDVVIPVSLLDALKIYLGIDPGDETQDPELEYALQIAIAVAALQSTGYLTY